MKLFIQKDSHHISYNRKKLKQSTLLFYSFQTKQQISVYFSCNHLSKAIICSIIPISLMKYKYGLHLIRVIKTFFGVIELQMFFLPVRFLKYFTHAVKTFEIIPKSYLSERRKVLKYNRELLSSSFPFFPLKKFF